jgi:ribosome-interacting GTPase 1
MLPAMPTNLPPEYFAAEHRYRDAKTPEEKAASLEELIGTIPKHKGTDKLRADLRRKLSKLKSAAQTKKTTSKHESAFHINKEGAGQVAVIGAANVGKSSLVAALTHATPDVADFPFSTWKPTPGMMPFEDIQIQLIDTPPLDREYVEPEMFDLLRRSDLALIIVDVQTAPVDQLLATAASLQTHHIIPEHQQARYADQQRFSVLPCFVFLNKNDDETSDENVEIFCELLEEDWPYLPGSIASGRNLEALKQELFERLEILRIYSKSPGKKPDFTAPFILRQGSTVEDFAAKVHQDFLRNLKSARVWGEGVYDGQPVHRDHVLHDRDVVELHI